MSRYDAVVSTRESVVSWASGDATYPEQQVSHGCAVAMPAEHSQHAPHHGKAHQREPDAVGESSSKPR